MIEIPVTRAVALIDDADLELVGQFKWRIWTGSSGQQYALANRPRPGHQTVRMHNLILGVSGRSTPVDHRNGNGLDNRRSNLRLATAALNGANSGPRKILALRRGGSPFKGVRYHHGGWSACIRHDGRQHHLGTFASEIEAAHAYNAAAIAAWGEFAYLNSVDPGAPAP